MDAPRYHVDPADLTWEAEAPHEEAAPGSPMAEAEARMESVIETLARTRARCRTLSERVMSRASSTAATLDDIPRPRRLPASSLRVPEPGTTDTVVVPGPPLQPPGLRVRR